MREKKNYSNNVFYFKHNDEVSFLWKTTINTINAKIPKKSICSSCETSLVKDSMVIKSDHKGYFRLHGLLCPKCRTLYVPASLLDEFSKICKHHFPQQIRNYTHPIQKEHKKIMKSFSKQNSNNGIVMIIETDNGNRYVVVEKNEVSVSNSISLHYTDVLARELLAASLRPEKEKRYNYQGESGLVVYSSSVSSEKDTILGNNNICIRKGGGLQYFKRGGDEFVKILFYSPFTKRYEVVNATYNKFDKKYFIDIIIWRRFIKEFGDPGFRPIFSRGFYDFDLSGLRESSILMDYGYSSAATTTRRREILTEMIDLKIVSVRQVLKYLQFFIDVPGAKSNMYNARSAWISDWNFIKDYKVNPQRFLIANFSPITIHR